MVTERIKSGSREIENGIVKPATEAEGSKPALSSAALSVYFSAMATSGISDLPPRKYLQT